MFLKVLCLVVFLCVVDEAFASCIQYGHACWGGHGKRNNLGEQKGETVDLKPQVNKEWFLSRLISPAEAETLIKESTDEETEEDEPKAKDGFYKLLQSRQSSNH